MSINPTKPSYQSLFSLGLYLWNCAYSFGFKGTANETQPSTTWHFKLKKKITVTSQNINSARIIKTVSVCQKHPCYQFTKFFSGCIQFQTNLWFLYSWFHASWLCINKIQQDATVCRDLFNASPLYMFRAYSFLCSWLWARRTPETCRVDLHWIGTYILLHLVGSYWYIIYDIHVAKHARRFSHAY